MNKVILIGYIGREPEQRGEKVVSLSLATKEPAYKRADGTDSEERTEWHSLTLFDPKARNFALKHVRKGSKVVAEGRIHYSTYKDKEGNDRQGVEIVVTALSFAD